PGLRRGPGCPPRQAVRPELTAQPAVTFAAPPPALRAGGGAASFSEARCRRRRTGCRLPDGPAPGTVNGTIRATPHRQKCHRRKSGKALITRYIGRLALLRPRSGTTNGRPAGKV